MAIPGNLFESNTFVSTCVFTFVISDISWNIEGHQYVYRKIDCSKLLIVSWKEVVEINLAQGKIS